MSTGRTVDASHTRSVVGVSLVVLMMMTAVVSAAIPPTKVTTTTARTQNKQSSSSGSSVSSPIIWWSDLGGGIGGGGESDDDDGEEEDEEEDGGVAEQGDDVVFSDGESFEGSIIDLGKAGTGSTSKNRVTSTKTQPSPQPKSRSQSQPLQTLHKLRQMLEDTDYATATNQIRQPDRSDETNNPSRSSFSNLDGSNDQLWTSKDRSKYKRQQQRQLPQRNPIHPSVSDEDYSEDADDGPGYQLPNLPVYYSDGDESETEADSVIPPPYSAGNSRFDHGGLPLPSTGNQEEFRSPASMRQGARQNPYTPHGFTQPQAYAQPPIQQQAQQHHQTLSAYLPPPHLPYPYHNSDTAGNRLMYPPPSGAAPLHAQGHGAHRYAAWAAANGYASPTAGSLRNSHDYQSLHRGQKQAQRAMLPTQQTPQPSAPAVKLAPDSVVEGMRDFVGTQQSVTNEPRAHVANLERQVSTLPGPASYHTSSASQMSFQAFDTLAEAGTRISFDSVHKLCLILASAALLCYSGVSPRNLPLTEYNLRFYENVRIVSFATIAPLIKMLFVFDARENDVNSVISTFFASFTLGYVLTFMVEVLVTTVVRLLVFCWFEPDIFALTPKVPIPILPWVLRENRYRPKRITLFATDFGASCVACPIIEEYFKLKIAQWTGRLPRNFNWVRNKTGDLKMKKRKKHLVAKPIPRRSGERDVVNSNSYITHMLAASAGLKLCDAGRRILLYTKPSNQHKSFYSFCRGSFPIQELCGTLTAINLAKRDLLGVEMPLWKLLIPGVVIHGMANLRGMKPIFKWNSSTPWTEMQLWNVPDDATLLQLMSKGFAKFMWLVLLGRVLGSCIKNYYMVNRQAVKRATTYAGNQDAFLGEVATAEILKKK